MKLELRLKMWKKVVLLLLKMWKKVVLLLQQLGSYCSVTVLIG
jgi:hypothetical protein